MNPRIDHSGRSALCQLRGYFEVIVTEQLPGYRTFTDRKKFGYSRILARLRGFGPLEKLFGA
jgi:hypothetical protein